MSRTRAVVNCPSRAAIEDLRERDEPPAFVFRCSRPLARRLRFESFDMISQPNALRPLFAAAGVQPGGALDQLAGGALGANGAPGAAGAPALNGGLFARDLFERGGRGFLAPAGATVPGAACGGAGQMPQLGEAELAQLVKLLIALMQQQQQGAGVPQAGPCGGAPAIDPMQMQALGGAAPMQLDGARDMGMLGGNQWGNVAPLVGSPLGGVNGAFPMAPPNALAGRALDWSAAQMNPATANAVNPNTGVSQAQNQDAWSNWCLAFVSAAYGYQVPELRAGTAFESYQNFAAQGRVVQDRNPPAGAPVYFDKTAGTPWGHVGIATGKTAANGDPIIRTTGSPGAGGIHEVPLSQLEQMTAGYLGWAKI